MNIKELEESAASASRLLRAMSNEKRLMILCRLIDTELSVGDLGELVGLSQSALSQHLAKLRDEGLVKTRKQAQSVFYSLEGDQTRRIIEVLHGIYCGPPASMKGV